MKKNIFSQTGKIVATVLAGCISGLIVNFYTQWWGALANVTNAVWETVSQATVNAITYRVPIWIVVIATALVALTWYATRRLRAATKVSNSNFLTYHQDFFDGVLCEWDYSPTIDRPSRRVRDIRCFCRYCAFAIGTPNNHEEECPSCSRRAVMFNNPPHRSGEDVGVGYGGLIKGYQARTSDMLFDDFIREEIERRIRTRDWQRSRKA